MCPPEYFSVEYVINPWMAGNEGTLDLDLAGRQWESLRDSLGEVADIVLMEPQLDQAVFEQRAGFEKRAGFEQRAPSERGDDR